MGINYWAIVIGCGCYWCCILEVHGLLTALILLQGDARPLEVAYLSSPYLVFGLWGSALVLAGIAGFGVGHVTPGHARRNGLALAGLLVLCNLVWILMESESPAPHAAVLFASKPWSLHLGLMSINSFAAIAGALIASRHYVAPRMGENSIDGQGVALRLQ